MDSLLEALFAFWSNKRSAIPADVFYQKMTTFGLAPNLKFIEDIMNIINFNKPKKIQKSPTRDSVSPDVVGRRNLSQSNISASILASSQKGDSPIGKFNKAAGLSPRKSNRSTARNHIAEATFTTTINSAYGGDKKGNGN